MLLSCPVDLRPMLGQGMAAPGLFISATDEVFAFSSPSAIG